MERTFDVVAKFLFAGRGVSRGSGWAEVSRVHVLVGQLAVPLISRFSLVQLVNWLTKK